MEGNSDQARSVGPDRPGLGAILEQYLEEMEERFGIGCRLTLDAVGEELSPEQVDGLDRVIREAVNNALLHSGAFRIEVSLRLLGGEVVARVEDDGRGIAQEEIDDPEARGLTEMRGLLEGMGGDLEIRGIPGDGTALVMRFPLVPGDAPDKG